MANGAKLYLGTEMSFLNANVTTSIPPCNLDDVMLSTPRQEPYWYAVYTCANHERRIADQLGTRGIEHFLPQYESVRKWKDRKVRLSLPLFPGYVFVHLELRERLRVLQVPGVVRLVGFNGQPAPIDREEMQGLQRGLEGGRRAEPWPYLTVGRRVRITSGPLQGLEGVLAKKKTICRFVLTLHLIQRSMAVEVDAADMEAVG